MKQLNWRLLLFLVTCLFFVIGCNFEIFSLRIPQLAVPTAIAMVAPPSTLPTKFPEVTSPQIKQIASMPNNIKNVKSLPNGEIIIVTDGAVLSVVDGVIRQVTTIPSSAKCLISDQGGIFILDSDTGQISSWMEGVWSNLSAMANWQPLDLEPGSNYTVAENNGSIWLLTPIDLRMLVNGEWKIISISEMGFSLKNDQDQEHRLNLFRSQTGTIWITECDFVGSGSIGGGGARWYDGTRWYGGDSPISSGCVSTIAEDDEGQVWVGVDKNIWRYSQKNNSWKEFIAPNSPNDEMFIGSVISISPKISGNVYAVFELCGGASCFGKAILCRLEQGTWMQVGSTSSGFVSNWGPIQDRMGKVWLGWEEGVYEIDQKELKLISPMIGSFAQLGSDGRLIFIANEKEAQYLWKVER